MANTKTTFGPLEQAVMDALWDRSPLSVRAVWQQISARRPLAYTTIMTVMARLAEQGHLRRQRDASGAFVYHPAKGRESFAADATRATVNDLVRRYGDAALVQFLAAVDRVPEEKIRALQRQVRAKKHDHGN